MTKMKRIDQLVPGTIVILQFAGGWGSETRREAATFIEMIGEGEERHAKFVSHDNDGKAYDWEAYRYQGMWAYGSSAQRLSLIHAFGVSTEAHLWDADDLTRKVDTVTVLMVLGDEKLRVESVTGGGRSNVLIHRVTPA